MTAPIKLQLLLNIVGHEQPEAKSPQTLPFSRGGQSFK